MNNNVNKYAHKSRAEVRRTDYAVTDLAVIAAWLKEGAFGVLATTHQEQPYATPVNYVYLEEDHAIYFHGAKVGRARANMALNPQVCFNVAQMGAFHPGERISNFGVAYKSVTVFGEAEEVRDEDKRTAVLLALMRKYFSEHHLGEDYQLPAPDELKRTAVYRIKVEEWSAKQHK